MMTRRGILFVVVGATMLFNIACKRHTISGCFGGSKKQAVHQYRALHQQQLPAVFEGQKASSTTTPCLSSSEKKTLPTTAPKRKTMVAIPAMHTPEEKTEQLGVVGQNIAPTQKATIENKKKSRPIKKEMDERLSRGLWMTIFGGVAVTLGIIFINLAPTGLFIFAFSIVFLVGLVSLISYWANPKPKM